MDSSRHKPLVLGKRVTDIRVLHSLVLFGKAVELGPRHLAGGVQLPAGLGYDVECINPSRVVLEQRERLAQQGCANFVDIGIVIGLEAADSVVIRTNGCHWAVFVKQGSSSAQLEITVPVALGDRTTAPLSRAPSSERSSLTCKTH